jgi:hypothetical protein
MSLCPAIIQVRHSNGEGETPMTTQTAATAFISALIVRLRASLTIGAQPTGIKHVHGRNAPTVDPVLIPAYRRRRLASRAAPASRTRTALIR